MDLFQVSPMHGIIVTYVFIVSLNWKFINADIIQRYQVNVALIIKIPTVTVEHLYKNHSICVVDRTLPL